MTIPQPAQGVAHRTSPSHTEVLRALGEALALLGAPGSGLIVAVLGRGPADLDHLREYVPGLTKVELACRLGELITAGLVTPESPSAMSAQGRYALDHSGRALLIPLAALTVWAQDHSCTQGSARPSRSGHPERPGS
ncbi:winged helix-turn-helix transcriptional regulator [Streptomyces sp. NPDC005236]|uniref:winged helix-turn-helix transcriptional regulator n=1 Tax=Streptomyces sp. NPDC005236 TaxID=3157028 RepID=UPI0033BABC9E